MIPCKGGIARLVAGLAAGLALASPGWVSAQASPVGRWLTEGDRAIIEIMPCGAMLCGTLRTILKPDPTAPTTDINNPDPGLRQRSTSTLTILSGFRISGTRWQGRIYDPRSGRTYKSFVEVRPDGMLALSGCIWLLCQTQNWRRGAVIATHRADGVASKKATGIIF